MKTYKVTPNLASVLEQLQEGMTQADFLSLWVEQGLPLVEAENFWAILQQTKNLREISATEPTDIYHKTYASWRSQRGMISDNYRTASFQAALNQVVKPGMHVADVGSGSGILSLFSARAGAASVCGLEITTMIDDAKKIAAANNFPQVQFIAGDAAEFKSPHPLDLIVSEWLGMYVFEEWRHFDAFAAVRDANLRPDGQVMPHQVRMFLCPLDDSRLYVERGPGYWERPVWGFDFSLVHRERLDPIRRHIVQANPRTLLARLELLTVDCKKDTSKVFFFEKNFTIPFAHSCSFHGFVGYFEAELAPGVVLDTSPAAPDTHWHQSYFPFDQWHIQGGDQLELSIKSVADKKTNDPVFHMSVQHIRNEQRLAEQHRIFDLNP